MDTNRKFMQVCIVTVLGIAWLVSACGPQTASPTETTPEFIRLTDGLDREVEFTEPVQRIVSIAPSNTEILFAIGAGSQVVGRDDYSDYPPDAIEVPSIGATYGDLNTEAIVSLEPDLVLAAMINSPEHIQAIEDLGITVFVIPNPMNFDDLYEILEIVGTITGRVAEAESLIEELMGRVDAVAVSLVGVDIVSVYYEVDGMDATAPWTIGGGTFQDMLIQLAGGRNITADLEPWVQISLEELIVRDPEIMIFSQGPWVSTTHESVAERAGWGDITAVARGAIYGIDANWIDRPGPRLVDALEAMASFIHPERFE